MQDLSVRIASRSDTLANWTALNPVLLNGEIAIVFDESNQLFKVGDGTSHFNDLPFSFYDQFASKQVNSDLLKAKNISQGYGSEASGIGVIATGYKSQVSSNFAQAHGYQAKVSSDFGYVWNGDNTDASYADHGKGTYNINPVAGISGVYIGDSSLADMFRGRTKVSVDSQPTEDLKLLHISYDEYAQLVVDENVDPHTIYVLSADGYDDQYGNRVTNVGEPISASDATTKKYVDESIAAIPPTDLTQYYKKSETSSAVELKTKFDTLSTYAEMHDQLSNDGYLTAHQSLADYYTKSQTSSATEISDAFDAIPLSNYVKLSSDNAQVISSEVGITKSLTVGSLSVVSNSSRFSYKLQSEESVNLQDRAINKLTMDSDLSVCFPAVKPGVARDFLLNLSYTSGQMTIVDEIEKCGDELSFTAGKQHLIAFTEIGIKNSLPQFYIRVIELD